MNKRYIVKLTPEERETLLGLIHAGKTSARRLKRARILLKVDQGDGGPAWTDERVAEALEIGTMAVRNTRRRFVEMGLEAINRKKQARPSRLRKLDGEAEARLIAVACGEAPEGRARWTLHLLADELVRLDVVDSISHDTIWRTLKKTNFNLT
jgi:transposase